MLPQEAMIERVRALCQQDKRIDAAMLYGSFTYGEGDACSDIEFLLFFTDDTFDTLDRRAWLEQIAPVELLYVNEFGITVVIFDNLVRGEFHFHRASEVSVGAAWPGVITFPSLEAALLVDKSGALTPYLLPLLDPLDRLAPDRLQPVVDGFINWWWFGVTVLRRGEHARALEILNITHRHLLWMARALAGQSFHWLTPSRLLEHDLPPETYARFRGCTAALDADALHMAYARGWAWGREMMAGLHDRFGLSIPETLCARLAEQIAPAGDESI
jgi:lincosamide nucleotidyltransferase